LAVTGATAAVVAARARSLSRRGARARELARAMRDDCQAVLRHHGIQLDAAGAVPPGPALIACNHVSWLDPLVVAACVPCAPISKLSVRGWPVVGALASRLGVIFHERGDGASGLRVLRQAERALEAGLPVLNFPEGTTTDGAGVLRFRKGLFGLARQLGVPVVPAAIRYEPADLAWTGDATFVPHYLRLAARGTSRVRLRFGGPLRSAADEGDAAALAEASRERVVALLEGA
ncbi:MAG TPA: lysophospholipid acyltransferase family protein, partial [Anaeromyxobacteraceae bacterium]|nr:lysophospholipid acyltransferase family protein [Anaeromyxobacteraceae bacterium]